MRSIVFKYLALLCVLLLNAEVQAGTHQSLQANVESAPVENVHSTYVHHTVVSSRPISNHRDTGFWVDLFENEEEDDEISSKKYFKALVYTNLRSPFSVSDYLLFTQTGSTSFNNNHQADSLPIYLFIEVFRI